MDILVPKLAISFLILADRAEVVNGKLYLMGGGWDRLCLQDPGQPVPLSFAVGVTVPWVLANERHHLCVWIEDADGRHMDPAIKADVEVGRPSGSIGGQSFTAILAASGMWLFPGPGIYRLVAEVAGQGRGQVVFCVLVPQTDTTLVIGRTV